LTPWQVKQDAWASPPLKLFPWQAWQVENPFVVAASGADFAAAPCESGDAHPAGWPDGPFAWHVIPPKLAEKQLTPEIPPLRSEPWHSVQVAWSFRNVILWSTIQFAECFPVSGSSMDLVFGLLHAAIVAINPQSMKPSAL
jgi:hypothetical protein